MPFSIRLALLSSALLVSSSCLGQKPSTVVPLWPHGAPEPVQTTGPERDVTTDKDALISGHRTQRITDVTNPTISVYPPKPGTPATHAAAVVFPGGGYVRLAWEGEGVDTCDWLNSIGMTCLLVKYRVPHKAHYPEDFADLEDAQQAMRLARQRAGEWGIDPHKVGAIGYSAGAHLAVVLSVHPDDKHVLGTPAAADVKADVPARPDFAIVMYPGYLTAPPALRELDPAVQPTKAVPPTFVLQAEDDPVHVENALVYYRALKEAGVPAELHVFPTGRHGFGVHPKGSAEEHWTDLATTWLRSIGMLQ